MNSFKKNVSATFAGNVVFAISQWILLILLAKLGGEQILGVYALALAVVSPVFALTNMNLRAVQATDAEETVNFESYYKFRYISSICAILVCFLIAVVVYGNKLDICLAIVCLSFYKYFESKSDLVHGFFQGQERMDLIAQSIMIRGVGNILIIATVYYITQNLVLSLAISILKSWVVYYFVDKKNYLCLYQKRDYVDKKMSDIFLISWPLGLVVFANTLNLNIPRYVIAHYYDETMVGIFASISYFIVAGATLVNAIGQSAVPRLAKLGITNMLAFKNLSRQIFLLIFLVGITGVLIAHYFGDWILRLVYTDAISNYNSLFIQIMMSGVAVYSSVAIGCSLTALRDFRLQGFFSIINIIIMTFTSLFLISSYGLAGAAAAIGITHLVKMFIAWLRMRFIYKYRKRDYQWVY